MKTSNEAVFAYWPWQNRQFVSAELAGMQYGGCFPGWLDLPRNYLVGASPGNRALRGHFSQGNGFVFEHLLQLRASLRAASWRRRLVAAAHMRPQANGLVFSLRVGAFGEFCRSSAYCLLARAGGAASDGERSRSMLAPFIARS